MLRERHARHETSLENFSTPPYIRRPATRSLGVPSARTKTRVARRRQTKSKRKNSPGLAGHRRGSESTIERIACGDETAKAVGRRGTIMKKFFALASLTALTGALAAATIVGCSSTDGDNGTPTAD